MMFATIRQVTKSAATMTNQPENPRIVSGLVSRFVSTRLSTRAYPSHACGIRAAQARARSPAIAQGLYAVCRIARSPVNRAQRMAQGL
jgi:hypothetical protein